MEKSGIFFGGNNHMEKTKCYLCMMNTTDIKIRLSLQFSS